MVSARGATARAAAVLTTQGMTQDKPIVAFEVGKVVRLAKPHPCGSLEWRVIRTGADIGLECAGCGRRVMLERRELERRFKGFVEPEVDA